MKRILVLTLVLASPLTFASTHRQYHFTSGTILHPVNLGRDLAQALNSMHSCDNAFMKKLDFGGSLNSFTYSSNRNGNVTYELVSLGQRPAPSFQNYKLTAVISKNILRREGPQAPDRGPAFETACSVDVTDIE